MQSETIQELTKTSQALASLQEQASELRKLADALKAENVNIVHAILVSLLFWGGGGGVEKKEILIYGFYLLVLLWYDKLVLLVLSMSFSLDFRSQKL